MQGGSAGWGGVGGMGAGWGRGRGGRYCGVVGDGCSGSLVLGTETFFRVPWMVLRFLVLHEAFEERFG